jgi:AraC-like DNA-binding protein
MNPAVFKNLLKRNSFLQRMLISIVCLLCVLLLCVQFFCHIRTGRELERHQNAQQIAKLQSLAASFENEIDELARLAAHAATNKDLAAPVRDNVNEYIIDAAASELYHYNAAHPMIDKAGIYYRTIDTVLFDGCQKEFTSFSELFYAGGSAGSENLEHIFSKSQSPDYFPTAGFDGSLNDTLIMTIPVSLLENQETDAVVFFTIDEIVLKNWCALLIPAGSRFAIMPGNVQSLILDGKFIVQESNDPDFQRFLSDPERTTYVHTAEPGTDIIYKYHDIEDNSVYLVAIPKDIAQKELMRDSSQMIVTLLVTVLLVCIFVTLTLYINYSPILRLLKRHIPLQSDQQHLSELELIDRHFVSQAERINNQKRQLAGFVVRDILCGWSAPEEDIERYFPTESYSSFAVVAADLSLTAEQSMQITQAIEAVQGGKLIITKVPNRPETVFVRAADTAIDIYALRDSLQRQIEDCVPGGCDFHMGLVVSELNKIQLSYYEALFAGKLADFSDDGDEREKISSLIETFEELLLSGNHGKAIQFVEQLKDAEQKLRDSIKHLFCYQIIHTYLSAVQRSGIVLKNKEIGQLLSYSDSGQMFSNLRHSIISLPTEAGASAVSPQERQEKLLAFVDKNYFDNTICLTTVADYMQTSIYTVSRLFKDCTGQGFKEYIMNKRLQKACSMLETSSLPVSEIATACGFDDANYFTVVFKRKYGMPPTKYRDEITSVGK